MIGIGSFLKPSAQTTEEEYNYVTKGYQIQLQSGLDMKKGYELRDVAFRQSDVITSKLDSTETQTTDVAKLWVKALWKQNGPSKKVVAYMLITQYNDGLKQYYCVPHPGSKSEIQQKFWDALEIKKSIYDQSKARLIIYTLSNLLKW